MSSRIAYTIPEACKAAGLGRTSIYKLIKAGQLPYRKHGTRTLILESDLRAFLEGLPQHTSRLKPPSKRRRPTAEGGLHPVAPVRGEG